MKIKSPIEQVMLGNGGLFRQQNMEKRKTMSVREWVELCNKDEYRAPAVHEVGLESRRMFPGATQTKNSKPRNYEPFLTQFISHLHREGLLGALLDLDENGRKRKKAGTGKKG